MERSDGFTSSDEEYYPTTEELEPMDEEPRETDGEEEKEEDAEDLDDLDYIDEDYEGSAAVERILLRSNPGLLREIQRVLEHGIGLRSNSSNSGSSRRRSRRRIQELPPIPYAAGKRLLNSGEFGEIDDRTAKNRRYQCARTITQLARFRELGWRKENSLIITKRWLPAEQKGRIVAQYDRPVYSGQFSHDGSFFYTASQDFMCRMYQTLNPANHKDWKLYKTVRAEFGHWTITDATLSHDNRYLAYSSITPCVYFAGTGSTSSMEADMGESWREPDDNQTVLDFSEYGGRASRFSQASENNTMDPRTGIWSLRFSADGRELVAGASDRCLYGITPLRPTEEVYDVETRRITLKLEGHNDDINAVCFADPSSNNILFSGSDDSMVKVWDRRSMAGGREAGCLPGHMEGITFVSTKGDGRYLISNGKDQTLKLWDIRKMMASSKFNALPRRDYCTGFDYRWKEYPGPPIPKHPNDCSVTTYTGHRVLKTLIRCHFSPAFSTGQQYLYSGSEDGRIHVWNLDGTIARIIDVGQALSRTYRALACDNGEGWMLASLGIGRGRSRGVSATVRDVSWHPYDGVLVSSSWTSIGGESGAVTVHAWDGEEG